MESNAGEGRLLAEAEQELTRLRAKATTMRATDVLAELDEIEAQIVAVRS